MNGELVSVIVPVYNGEAYLELALRSIQTQDYRPIEIIVVDDGSTDRSADVARSFEGVQYLHQPNAGPSAARNAGLAVARGEFMAFLDADDEWLQGKLEIQISYHRDHPDVGCTVTHRETFMHPGTPVPDWLDDRLLETDAVGYLPSALVARAEVFEKVGHYNAQYMTAESLDWFVRVREAGIRVDVLPDILLRKRVHDRNLTRHMADTRTNVLGALRASIHRNRKSD
ncbi:MAG: glycosyltransferase family 2 protein [Lentisphaerae bacterium]|nr:glycosyltransferase family 2 protein [Lentisphaerota bacterium]